MNNIDEIRSLATRILELTSDDGRHVKVVKSFLVKYRYMQWETKDVLDVLLHVSSLNNGHMRVNTCSAWVEDHCAFETLSSQVPGSFCLDNICLGKYYCAP